MPAGTGGRGADLGGSTGAATGGAPSTGGAGAAGSGMGGTIGKGGSGGGKAGTNGGGSSGGGGRGVPSLPPPPAAITCTAASSPATGLVTDFAAVNATGDRWGSTSGVFGTAFHYNGGPSSSSSGTVESATQTLRFGATVTMGGYAGTGIVFDACQAFGATGALSFSFTGSVNCSLEIQLQTYSGRPATDNPAGGCRPSAGITCMNTAKAANVSTSSSPVTVPLSSFTGWNAATGNEVVGVLWLLTNKVAGTPCTADLGIDDVRLVP